MRATNAFQITVAKWVLLACFIYSVPCFETQSCNLNDFSALKEFVGNLTEGKIINSWADDLNCCEWEGVFCNAANDARVIKLVLGNKGLKGVISGSLGQLHQLRVLDLSFNRLEGGLPSELSNLQQLSYLDVSQNKLSGIIRDDISQLSRLKILIISSNAFSGLLPASLSKCSLLQMLDVHNNSFTGPIDLDFSGLPNLYFLDVASNRFCGGIPTSLSTCRKLETLSIARTDLNGEIPSSFMNLTSLSFFSSSNNSLVNLAGALTTFQQCRNLTALILTSNFHGESLLGNFSGFDNLRVLALGSSDLHGEIPAWLLNCTMLEILDLSSNYLRGSIPLWMAQMDHLFYLDLSGNLLTGEIPNSLIHLKSLISTQSISRNPSASWDVKRNQIGLDLGWLQYNQLNNFLPSLNFSNNMFSGEIPSQIGMLKQLHVLDLSRNHITGLIPDSMSDLVNLEVLNLSVNELYGSIPRSLTNLAYIWWFSVAYNHLQGEIPGLQFETFPDSSFEGNPGLCGYSQGPPCNIALNSSDGSNIASGSKTRFDRNIIFHGLAIVGEVSIVFLLFTSYN